jgi:hypothetical protein
LQIDPAVLDKLKGELAAAAARKASALIDVQHHNDAAAVAQAKAEHEDQTLMIGRQFAVSLGLDPDNL